MLILPEHLSSPPIFSGVRVTLSFLCVCFVDRCLSVFFWPLCCLFFFDLRNQITPMVSSNSSYTKMDNNQWNCLCAESLNSDGNQFHQYIKKKTTTTSQLKPLSTQKDNDIRIQIIAWDRHINVAGLSCLMGS